MRSSHEAEFLEVFAEMRNELGRRPGILHLSRFYVGITADVLRRRIEGKKPAPQPAVGSGPRFTLPRWLFELRQDMTYGIRSLTRSKTFTVIAVLSLALGIGVNTGLFTFVNTTLQPVPGVNRAEQVVEILGTSQGREMEVWSYPDFKDVRETTIPIELAG